MLNASARRAGILAALFVSAVGFATPCLAIEPGFAVVQNIVNVFSGSGSASYSSAAKFIDYDAMSQRSLGAGQWSKLTVKQKRDYTAALRVLMEQRYYPRWHRIFSKAKLEYVSKSVSGDDLLVQTNLVVGKKRDAMTWRLSDRNDKVISLAIGQKDLLDRLTNRLQPKLKKSGFQSMLSWMQAHAKGEEPATQTSSAESVLGESR
ncbi:MAG: ABC transporter substrate-binding protein [Cyanobacteria bacterium SZAS-4]|nr:ABC transporter substrate-binding protein [Cyanobacteria bacterium SZAS-4]